jgi:F-type H+-transporting ATPase subunit delta
MTQKTAAARYARALFDVALAEDDPVVIEPQLTAVADVFTSHADLWRVVTNPAIPVQKKRGVVEQLLPLLDVRPPLQKLVRMLATRDRLALLPDLLETYRSRLLDHQKVVRVDVTTAVPLESAHVTALSDKLATVTGRKVVLHSATRPDLLGGVVAQIGSTVYDGSVKRQLEIVCERLKNAV